MNPIMNMLGGGNNMMMQAFSAMMRGENPRAFLQSLVGSTPQLQGLDLNNLQQTAQALCQKNNINMEQLSNQIKEFANSNTNKL